MPATHAKHRYTVRTRAAVVLSQYGQRGLYLVIRMARARGLGAGETLTLWREVGGRVRTQHFYALWARGDRD